MRPLLQLLPVLALSAAAGARAEESAWTSPRGTPDGRATCVWSSPGPPPEIREWHYSSSHRRRYTMGTAVWASPALALVKGRRVAFIGGYDQRVHALDLAVKRPLWVALTNGEIGGPPAVGPVGGEQVVFWGSADLTVYAVYADPGDDEDGRILWTRQLIRPTTTHGQPSVSAPLLHAGRLYITCFVYDRAFARSEQCGWLYCLDATTGRALWRQEVSQGPVGHPVGREIDGRFTVFLCARKGLLQAWDVSGARPRRAWTYQMPHEVMGAPAVETGTGSPLLFQGSKFGNLHAIDARSGEVRWKQMAGNWIDNAACVGEIGGVRHVFVGAHDYNVYAYRASDGELRWKRHLGGEIYSAPAFFLHDGKPLVTAAALDNHLYVLDADTGAVYQSYYTGTPIWDKVAKGETLWGSSAVFQAGEQTAIVHGSFNDFVYVYPLNGECDLRTKVQSPATLWWGLLVTFVLFAGVILPVVLRIPESKPPMADG